MLIGPAAIQARKLLRQIAFEPEVDMISGTVCGDPIHMLICWYQPLKIRMTIRCFKGIPSHIPLFESSTPDKELPTDLPAHG